MRNYFIESFKIAKLWGHRDIDLTFHKDVNILIGPNASGKTTILSLLHAILSVQLQGILNFDFERAEIKLKEFKGGSVRTVTAECDAAKRFLKLGLGNKRFYFRIPVIRRPEQLYLFSERDRYDKERLIRQAAEGDITRVDELIDLVPLVWLPVSRRLPIVVDREERYRRSPLESVDLRLQELLEGLSHYHSILNTQLSKRYGEFERQVLSMILYNREHDQVDSILKAGPFSLPTKAEKEQLRKAFKDAGLLDDQMRRRINDHFAAAEESVKRISDSREVGLELEDILVFPLISRTKDMVGYARELEEDRERIFTPLNLYTKTVNSFLEDKTVQVDESGRLEINQLSSQSELEWQSFSSGEKQLLILLTQALLKVDEPVVYVADEPELSLHVTWQSKLLESLVTLGGDMQVIVATHSPDIVGKFQDNVIALGRHG